MKKIISFIILTAMVFTLFGCTANTKNDEDKLKVVTTIFPQYDFVRQIAGDNVSLKMLLKPGVESHSYEPTPADIIAIQDCDLFITVGGENESWVENILKSFDSSKIKVLKLMDCVDVVETEHDHDHDHGHSHEVNPDDIKDRPLTDWEGSWNSGIPFVNDGSLDGYISGLATSNGTTADVEKNNLLAKWKSEYNTLKFDGDKLSINGQAEAQYKYAGYELVTSENGDAVWYKFEIVAETQGMPKYIAFNDHGTGGDDHDHEDEHDHEEDHDHEGAAHFHLRYGDTSFEEILSIENWAPTFFDASASGTVVNETMSGHSHSSHDEEEEHDHGDDHEHEFDEHVWTSPKNAIKIVNQINEILGMLDSENAESYNEKTQGYITELNNLDSSFREIVDNAARKTLIFGDRFPFRYFADEYGLEYFAAFPGCSTETEPSAGTIKDLIDKVKNEQIPVVFYIELSNMKIANTIIEGTNAKNLLFHSCHNVTSEDFSSGVTYVSLMQQNVETLREALS